MHRYGAALVAALVLSANGSAFSQDATTAKLQFEVASIRQNTADANARNHIYSDPHAGEFRTVNAPLKMILEYAYEMPQTRIVGAPPWVDSTKFDINAKCDPALSDTLAKMSNPDADQTKRAMVRSLLADRFGLVAHQETREMPVFDLVVAKGGPKLQKSDDGGTTWNWRGDSLDLSGGDHSLDRLCDLLSRITGRVVFNKTRLDGRYKLSLKWTPDDIAASGRTSPDAPPDLFTAIQEQLGLKLEPAKGPVPVLVIDNVTMPTEN